jgi:AAA15 family ATPase/GTPase
MVEFDSKEIKKEILDYYPEGRRANLFYRECGKEIKWGTHLKGEKKKIEQLLLPNTLFLTRAANLSMEQLFPVYRYFTKNMIIHVKMDSKSNIISTTAKMDETENYKDNVLNFLNAADLNIKDIKIEKINIDISEIDFPKDMPDDIKNRIINDISKRPKIGHPIFSKDNKEVGIKYFDLSEDESSGTVKMFDISQKIINSLKKGSVLIIDEFDSGLHPLLTKYIVNIFNNKETNPNKSQLIVATHDTCIMDNENLKREQIWFTDKNIFGETELFSLDEFDKNEVRKNSPFAKWYLDGRFKAVPTIDINRIKTIFEN